MDRGRPKRVRRAPWGHSSMHYLAPFISRRDLWPRAAIASDPLRGLPVRESGFHGNPHSLCRLAYWVKPQCAQGPIPISCEFI